MSAAVAPLIDPVNGFRDAMIADGLVGPREIIADGKIHRCDAARKGGKGDAFYIYFGDGTAAGCYGDWADGEWHKWCSRAENSLSQEQKVAFRLRMEAARRARETEGQKRHAQAAIEAETKWSGVRASFRRVAPSI